MNTGQRPLSLALTRATIASSTLRSASEAKPLELIGWPQHRLECRGGVIAVRPAFSMRRNNVTERCLPSASSRADPNMRFTRLAKYTMARWLGAGDVSKRSTIGPGRGVAR